MQQIQPVQQRHQLGQGQLLSLRVSATTRLRIVKGQVWITIEGVLEDHILKAGESIELAPGHGIGQSVLIEGLSTATLETQAAQEPAGFSALATALAQAVRQQLQRWRWVGA